jgi:hypothetical protein
MQDRGLSIIKDGAKARIVSDQKKNTTKGIIGRTTLSSWDRKGEISKSRPKISIKSRSSDYMGKGDIKQKLRLAMRQRKRERPRAGWVRHHSWNGMGEAALKCRYRISIKVKIEGLTRVKVVTNKHATKKVF